MSNHSSSHLESLDMESGLPAETIQKESQAQAPASTQVLSTPQRKLDFGFIPIPPHCRHNPDKPFTIQYWQAGIFAFASTFSMNLYYCQPILIDLEQAFHVDDVGVSKIPTLLQAGYALGLVLLTPLGDLVRRRQLLFLLMVMSASLSIGLAIANSLVAFEVLSFFTAVFSVTPQVITPLVAELAPAKRRSTFIAIAFSGLLIGVMLARVLSGVIADQTTYKNVYWMGVAAHGSTGQYALLIVLYFICPDIPPRNAHLSYFQILYTMGKLAMTQPLLIQSSIIILIESAVFSCFWVTLTLLLAGPTYNLSTLDIGLFALVGLFGIMCSPFVGRTIDGLVHWTASLIAIALILVSQAIQTGAGGVSLGAVVIVILLLDVGVSALQVALSTRVFAIDPAARSRLNGVLVLSIFIGQVVGTSAGTKIYDSGGFHFTGTFGLGCCALMLCILFVRGPHVQNATWFGWEGGTRLTKRSESTNLEK